MHEEENERLPEKEYIFTHCKSLPLVFRRSNSCREKSRVRSLFLCIWYFTLIYKRNKLTKKNHIVWGYNLSKPRKRWNEIVLKKRQQLNGEKKERLNEFQESLISVYYYNLWNKGRGKNFSVCIYPFTCRKKSTDEDKGGHFQSFCTQSRVRSYNDSSSLVTLMRWNLIEGEV